MKQHLEFLLRLSVARQDHVATVDCRQMDIDHLDRPKFLQHGSRREPRRQFTQPSAQGHVQAIRQESHEDMRFNSPLLLMVNRTQRQIAFEILERLLHLRQLGVVFPQLLHHTPVVVFLAVFEPQALFEKHLGSHYARANTEEKRAGLHYSHFQRTRTTPSTTYETKTPKNRYSLTRIAEVGLDRLQQEFTGRGKGAHFQDWKLFLTRQASQADCEASARRLGMGAGAVTVAVHRMRERYGELLRETVAHTVANPAEVDVELRHLFALLGE
jgi:hypothetical protein